jgi:hypothetical protein
MLFYFQFKKDRPDLRDPATTYLFKKYNLKHKKCQFPLGNLVITETLPTKTREKVKFS